MIKVTGDGTRAKIAVNLQINHCLFEHLKTLKKQH